MTWWRHCRQRYSVLWINHIIVACLYLNLHSLHTDVSDNQLSWESVGLWAVKSWVRILLVPEKTFGGYSSSSLTIPRCKIGTRSWSADSELSLRITICKQGQSVGNDGSTLAFKPTGRVNRSLKQRVPLAPQNGDLSLQKLKKKEVTEY